MKKRILYFLLTLCLLLSLCAPLRADAENAGEQEIRTYEELLKIAEDPYGDYRLMTDIDLKGRSWTPFDFYGSFNGNGHALLNVSVKNTGNTKHVTLDGNRIEYETAVSGFFASLINARVQDLKLLGIDISLNTAEPTFAGGLAGFMENSTVSGCTVSGKAQLETSGHSFGLGGIAGFGYGTIENTKADMTLICVDTDREYKDEQFMGGAYAAGYIDLRDNTIRIDGYDSDHGYVHDGGLVGMYILYPEDSDHYGFFTGNTVEGKITFFEDNEDRRAYCEAFIGEIMNWSFENDEYFSDAQFLRDEVFDYGTDLMPHYCENVRYETTVTEPTETENGYTLYRCPECGYTYYADYTPVKGSFVPEPETSSAEEEETEPAASAQQKTENRVSGVLIAVIVIVALIVIFLAVLLIRKSYLEKKRRQRRRSSGGRPSGARPSGERPSGTRPSGTRPSGERPSGGRPSGTRPSGERSSGTRPRRD